MVDQNFEPATLYREFDKGEFYGVSHLLYIREDLLKKYLKKIGKTIIWVNWGEKTFHHDEHERVKNECYPAWQEHQHIHKLLIRY